MVVLIVNDIGVSVFKPEGYPPVAGYGHAPHPRKIALQHVQAGTGKVHIRRHDSMVQQVKNHGETAGVLYLYAFCTSSEEKDFQSLVRETFYHGCIV